MTLRPTLTARTKVGKKKSKRSLLQPPIASVDGLSKEKRQQTHKRKHKLQTRAAQPDIRQLLERLPAMSLSDLRGIWLNCNNKRATAPNKDWILAANRLQIAVEKEWSHPRAHRSHFGAPFTWPSTEVPGGDGDLTIISIQSGMLDFLQYHVGRRNGRIESERRAILSSIFLGRLPDLFPPEYQSAWGEPRTAKRLQKMAETIAAFTRNAKRRHDERLEDAISDWCKDLSFLYENYFIKAPMFSWPSVAV